jgi:hypothetical protein
MDASRAFGVYNRSQPIGERATFVGTFVDPICPNIQVNDYPQFRTLGYVFAHVWVFPIQTLRRPLIFSWISPTFLTPISAPVQFFEVKTHWIREFYPPCTRIHPSAPDDSSSSSSEDSRQPRSRASSAPPDYDYVHESSITDQDLEYGYELVSLAENAPDVD